MHTDWARNCMSVARDASRVDNGINSSQLDPAAGHAPERVHGAQESDEHEAQEGVHEGVHLVSSPRWLGRRRCPTSYRGVEPRGLLPVERTFLLQ